MRCVRRGGLPADQFTVLQEKMRFFRDRYFKMPPLTDGDWASTQELDPNSYYGYAIYVGS
ncbi:MAG: hypothetical protein LBL76_01365 [Treponema sp.]|jgi:hypothetical protein|nr:hypothetical protein [Treponema sp.]